DFEKKILSKETQAESLAREIERAERHKKIVADEMKQSTEEIRQLEEKRKNLETNLENAQKALAETDARLNSLNGKLDDLKKELEKHTAELNRKRTEMQIAEERRRQTTSVIRRVENEISELQRRILNFKTEAEQSDRKIRVLVQEINSLEDSIEEAEVESAKEQTQIQLLSEELKNLREQEAELEQELSKLNKELSEIRNRRAAIEIEKAEAKANLKNLSENCYQQLGTQLAEIIENDDTTVDLEEARKTADELTAKIESLGAINMLAVEDLHQAEQRLNFLIAQKSDILKSIEDAEEALKEIKKHAQQKFLDAFNAINENFKRIFKELFGGGSGEMKLIGMEEDEILESGIEIIAQPPGKRLQNVLLLSGGEKAMVALALTLAIFEYRPSPFCILDEVDAPLDDANIDRFVGKLKQMASKTQFIVITHNKKTMEAAQVLYGVTMQERGISKLVSVKLV
ncbi:MAG: chromosome segregation protein SMC, partial [Pyrinomonadaceae bacterium]